MTEKQRGANAWRRRLGKWFSDPLVSVLARTGVTPNMLSWFGLLLALVAAGLVAAGYLVAGGVMVAVAGLFDTLDGALARRTGRVTRFGGVLDSVLDRISEAVLLLAVMYVFQLRQAFGLVMVTGVALFASLMVSYVRSRAETVGVTCEVGVSTRPERVVIMVIGLLLSSITGALEIAVGIIALLSLVTVIQRLYHVWRQAV